MFFRGSSSDEVATYRVGLRREFSTDFMLFGSFATGHKGQTYDLTTGFNQGRADAGPVDPEESRSYDAYGVLNLSVGIHQADDRYRVMLFVNNVLDEGYAVNGGNQFGNFGSNLATEILPARDFERYAGVRLSLSFSAVAVQSIGTRLSIAGGRSRFVEPLRPLHVRST